MNKEKGEETGNQGIFVKRTKNRSNSESGTLNKFQYNKIPMKIDSNKPLINLLQMEVVPHEENFEYEFPQQKTMDQLT